MNRAFKSRALLPCLLQRSASSSAPRIPLALPPRQTATAAAALFHSTVVLQRRRNSRFRFNSYATRFRRKEARRAWIRDANIYLEHLLKGYQDPRCAESSNYASWFEKQYFSKNRKKGIFHDQEFHWESYASKKRQPIRVLWTDSDSEEFDSIFGSAFGGQQDTYGSFGDRNYNGRYTRYKNKHSWDWKEDSDNENDTTEEPSFAVDRLALGLTASGPLKLEEVKKAYRACALNWHPDRHQGSTKAFAEEKFKHCTAAYKALCDELVSQT